MSSNITTNLQSWASSLWSPASAPAPETESGKLQVAIESDSRIVVQEMLKDPNLVMQALPNGELPLNYAIRQGHVDTVKWIASNYLYILDTVDHHGLTAIDHALISGKTEIAGILLGIKLNADFEAVTDHFEKQVKSYDFAKEIAFTNTVREYCTPSSTTLSGVFASAAEGETLYVLDALRSGVDVNATTSDGWSLLHLAVKSGNEELVKLLIEIGARVDLITNQGLTALHIASTGTSHKILQRLLDAGARLEAMDMNGSTPLHYAMTMDKLFTGQFLIEKGGKYSIENALGMTPLSIAAAMTCIQSDSRDELKVGTMQKIMFAGIAASCLAGFMGGSVPLEILSYAATIVPMAHAFNNTKTIAGKLALAGTVALSFIPGVNVVAQALKTYAVGIECIKGISNAWKHRHIEAARPIRNAIIYGVTAGYMGSKMIEFNMPPARSTIVYGHREPGWQESAKYAFRRDNTLDRDVQDLDKALAVYNTLQSNHNQPNIEFDEGVLNSYDHAGTCSAMALDFVARMTSECAKLGEANSFEACVASKEPFYKANNPGFASVQSAFNAIKVVGESTELPLDTLTGQKMQALASYHDMSLTPMSRSLYRGENIEPIIEKLPLGSYVVRLLSPTGNHKLESYGHSMGFIKRADKSIFFDNSKGARIIDQNVTKSVMENLSAWPSIPMVRLYKAECPSEGCTNLADGTFNPA